MEWTSQARVQSPFPEVVRRVPRVVWLVVTRIGAFLVLFQLYKLVRKTFIQRAERVAFDHAEQILEIERWLWIDNELGGRWSTSGSSDSSTGTTCPSCGPIAPAPHWRWC